MCEKCFQFRESITQFYSREKNSSKKFSVYGNPLDLRVCQNSGDFRFPVPYSVYIRNLPQRRFPPLRWTIDSVQKEEVRNRPRNTGNLEEEGNKACNIVAT